MTDLTTMPHKDDEAFEIPKKWTKSGRKKAIPFPYKLMYVITRKEYGDMIAWLPDGKSFRILLPSVFTSKVLPIHFKQAKYSSFKRKLHRWGFDRKRPEDSAESNCPSWFGSDEAFCHENFQKNRFDLLELMVESKPMSQMNMKPAGPIIPKMKVLESVAKQPKPEESVATANRVRRRKEEASHPLTTRPVKRRATEGEIRELEARISALAAAKQRQNVNKSITQTPNFNSALETRVRQCERRVAALNAATKRTSAPTSLSNNRSEAAIIRSAAVAAARAVQNSTTPASRTVFPSFAPTPNKDATIRAAALAAAAANDSRPMMSGNTLNTLMEIEITRRVRERLATIGLNRESSMISSLSSQIAAPSPSVDTRGIHWNTLTKATSPKLSIQTGSISLEDLPMTNIIMPRTA